MLENHLSSAANKRPLLSHYDLQAPQLPSFRIECRNAIQCFVRLSTRTLSKIRVKLSCRNGEVLILNNPFGQAHLHSSSCPPGSTKVRTSANSSPSQMIAPVVPTASESKSTISWSEPHHCHPGWPKIFINFPVTFWYNHPKPSQVRKLSKWFWRNAGGPVHWAKPFQETASHPWDPQHPQPSGGNRPLPKPSTSNAQKLMPSTTFHPGKPWETENTVDGRNPAITWCSHISTIDRMHHSLTPQSFKCITCVASTKHGGRLSMTWAAQCLSPTLGSPKTSCTWSLGVASMAQSWKNFFQRILEMKFYFKDNMFWYHLNFCVGRGRTVSC